MDGSIAPSNSEIQWQRFARSEQVASQNSKQIQTNLFEQILGLRTTVTIPATPAVEFPKGGSDSKPPKADESHHRASQLKESKDNDSKQSEDDETAAEVSAEVAGLVPSSSPPPAAEGDEPETVDEASGISINLTETKAIPQTAISPESPTVAAPDSSDGKEPIDPQAELSAANENLPSDAQPDSDSIDSVSVDSVNADLANESLTPATDGLDGQVQSTAKLKLPEQPIKAPIEVDSQTTLAAPAEAAVVSEDMVEVAGTHANESSAEVVSQLGPAQATAEASTGTSAEALQPIQAPELSETNKLPEDATDTVTATAKASAPTTGLESVTPEVEPQREIPSELQLSDLPKPLAEGLQNESESQPVFPLEDQARPQPEDQDASELAPPVERQDNARKKWYESSANAQQRSERDPEDRPRGVVGSQDGLVASHSERGFQTETSVEAANQSPSAVDDLSPPNDLWPNPSTTVHNIVANPLATGVSAATLIAEVGSTTSDVSNVGVDVLNSTSSSRRASAAHEPNTAPVAKSHDITQQEQARLIQRISRSFSRLSPTGGQINLRLHPPQLGALNMQVRLEGRTMTAKLTAETTAARDAILESLPILRGRLAEQGFDVSQFQVEVADDNANAAFSNKQGQDNLGQQGREDRTPYVDYRRVALANRSVGQADLESIAPISQANWGLSRGIDVQA